jgi:DNA-directed RNA polymerase specialized sigma24 family protein
VLALGASEVKIMIGINKNKVCLIACLKILGTHIKDAVFMQYFHGKTYTQIAKTFNQSENTIQWFGFL